MRYGIILPNLGQLANPNTLIESAKRAENLGFDGVFLSDHLTLPTTPRSRYPYRSDGSFPLRPDQDVLEPVVAATYVSAITERVQIGFSVMVLPYRHPVLNAKMLSTLDVLSKGRVVLGVGVGWMEQEFFALGSDFANRGQTTDEHIKLLKTLWTRDEPEFAGEHYQLSGMTMYPKPAQKPHPPIWTGGISQKALSRAARLGDGWHGIRTPPHRIGEVRAQLKQLREQSGQSFAGFEISLRCGLDFTKTELPASRLPLRGSLAQVTDDIRRYEEAGLTYLVMEPRARDSREFMAQMEQMAQEVWPLL